MEKSTDSIEQNYKFIQDKLTYCDTAFLSKVPLSGTRELTIYSYLL